ncbi:DUF2567 domain-containing protein [Haloactinomyces albus]|uniref:DUF2567 domain-containing protein n=1 Tax=Haloactinomyces albus TaxID=1352928 RepID=A0AAE4CJX1_9ACTN|nr:DUF2567 domain-containing protein [Haloactinomyces albus]MDR7300550.1 hypothetical protein [Haloactinomyces albus]
MPQGPVEAQGTRAMPMRVPPAEPQDDSPAVRPPRVQTSRVVVKAALLPALGVLLLVSLLGVPLGGLWSLLAPPQESVVAGGGELVPVLVESYHRFDALAIFLLLSSATGVLTGAALWMLRGRRGPLALIGAVLGSLLAAWLGMRLGVVLAAGAYPMPENPQAGDVVVVAPKLSNLTAVVCQPLAVALVYGLAASWNSLDDLGRRS